MCNIKRYFIPMLLLLLLPTFAVGQQITISGKAKEIVDPSIPKDEAIYEFVSNRPDLLITSSSSKIDSVYPEIYPEGDLTRYKVRLKLTNGVDRITTRNFRLTVNNTTVFGEHPNKKLKGGTRYEVTAMVPELVIDQQDRTLTKDFYTVERKAQLVLLSKYQLDISLVGFNRRYSPTKTSTGLYQYEVVVDVDSLNSDGMVDPQLLVTVKGQKSNNIYIDLSELKSKNKKTYEIYKVDLPHIQEQRGSVVFNITPPDVETLITFAGQKDSPAKGVHDGGYLRYGAYPYEVKASNDYHTESGIIVVDRDRKDVPINLKTRYGTLIVQGAKAAGATIYLNGEKMGIAPYTNKRVISGKYTLRVTKERCDTYEEVINIEDGQTLTREPEMPLRYAHLLFTVGGDAEIWINGKLSGKGKVEGDFEGEVIVECKKEHHTSTTQKIVANKGEYRSIALVQPSPKIGKLHVSSSPTDAQVFVDGELQKSGTPVLVAGLMEGTHEVLVRKKGKADEYRDVTIRENQEEQLNVQLRDAYPVKVRTNASEYSVKVNGRDLGKVKTVNLPVGDHSVVLSARGYEDYSKTVSIPGMKELKAQMQPKSYTVTVKSDNPDTRFQRDGGENLFYVNKPLKLDYGQHTLNIISDGISTEMRVAISSDTTIEVNLATLQSESAASETATGAKDSKGKAKNKSTERSTTSTQTEKPTAPRVVIVQESKVESSPLSQQVVEETSAGTEDYEEEDLDDDDALLEESDEIVDLEQMDQQFKYKDFSRWTLDINMARPVYKGSMYLFEYSNSYLLGGTLAITGKRGWGFYLTGYFGESRYYHGFNIYGIPNFDYSKSDEPSRDGVGILGFVRRLGSPRSVIDAQLYLGAGALFHQTYVAKQRYVYEPSVQDYVNYTYLRKNGVMPKLCIDAGLRFGLDHRTKFGWFNFTLGGMYVVGIDRFYLTGGISLGNAAVAGALIGYLGIPSMF